MAVPAALSLGVSWLFILLPLSLSLFNVSQSLREQYDLIDAFNVIKNSRGDVLTSNVKDSKIVIVDISNILDRDRLADVLDTVLMQDPLVVGFDVGMWENHPNNPETDLRLSCLLKDNPKVVLPCQLLDEFEPGARNFLAVKRQFFLRGEHFPATNEAAVNVDQEGVTMTVRHYTTVLSLLEEEVPSLPVGVLKIAHPSLYDSLIYRNRVTELINFRRASYIPVTWSPETVKNNLGLLKGKVVLIGDLSDEADKFNTPIDSRMPGVVLHAMTLDSLIRDTWIHETPRWLAILLAFFLSLPLVPVFRFVKKKTTWSGVLLPLLQTGVILFFVFLSYWLFVRLNYYIQPIFILLSVGFLDWADNLYEKL